jgi:hypothetical protein
MVAFIVNDFRAMLPRRSSRLIPQSYASQATNTDIFAGTLRGFRGLRQLADFTGEGIQAVYRIPDTPDDLWLKFTTINVDVAKSPLVNDLYDRYYITEQGQVPKYTTRDRIAADDPPWDLGIPRPTSELAVTPTGGIGLAVTRAYTYAFVTELGEIGPATTPTLADGLDDGTWELTGIQDVPPDSANRSITHVNLYRTITSTSGVATYFFLAQIPLGILAYTDNDSTALVSLNEQYNGFSWLPPPTDLVGLTELPSGALAGFSGTDLYFSEPFQPYAWPREYTIAVDYPIVGLAAVQNGVVILTESAPAVAFGSAPGTMSLIKSSTVEPCLSKRSIVPTTEGVFYASQNGLVLATPSGMQVMTKQAIDPDQWETDFNPASLRMARAGTRLIAIEETGIGFFIDPTEESGSIIDLDLLVDAVNVVTDARSGEVLVISEDVVYEWEGPEEDRSNWLWRSKEFQIPNPTNMGVAMVHLTPFTGAIPGGGPAIAADKVLLTVFAGGVQRFQAQVGNREQVRLPSGFKSDLWQFEVEGYAEVHSVALANTPAELTGV